MSPLPDEPSLPGMPDAPQFRVNDFVFAKVASSPPWPAIVMPPVSTEEVPLPKKGDNVQDYRWVYFMGSHNYSWVREGNLKPYEAFRDKYVSIHKKISFKEAVVEMDEHVEQRRLDPSYIVEDIIEFKGGASKKKPAERPKSRLGNRAKEHSQLTNGEDRPKVGRPRSRIGNQVEELNGKDKPKVARPRSRIGNQVEQLNGEDKPKVARPRSRISNQVEELNGEDRPKVARPRSRIGNQVEGPKVGRPRSRLANHVSDVSSKRNAEHPNSSLISHMRELTVQVENVLARPKSRANNRNENNKTVGRKTPSENQENGKKRRRPSSAVSSGYFSSDIGEAKRSRPAFDADDSDDNDDDDGEFPGEPASYMQYPPQFFKLDTAGIEPTDKSIGVLGLGIIGRHVVCSLVQSGHRVNIWNRTAAKRKQLEVELRPALGKNLFGFSDVRHLLKKSDVLLVCVAGYELCKEFVQEQFGVNDANDTILEGKSVVVMSQLDPTSSMDICDMVTDKGASYLEAQFQWGDMDEKVMLFVAGDQNLFEECQSCFKAVGTVSLYFGKTGYASKIMLIYQMMRAAWLASLGESMYLAKRFKDDLPEAFHQILEMSTMGNHFVLSNSWRMQHREFRVSEQSLCGMQKDLQMGLAMADAVGQPMPLVARANELFKQCCHVGYGKMDSSVVFLRNMH